MTTLHPRRSVWLAFALVALTALFATAQAPEKEKDKAPPPDPAEVRLRALLAAKLDFKAYVFGEEKFPEAVFDQPAKIEELIGSPFTIKTAYYDKNQQPVESAKGNGVYGAVVEVMPKSGRPMRRYYTLFRTAEKPDPTARFQADAPHDLAKSLGLDPALLKQEAKAVAEQLKDRPFSDWSRDPRAARLLAGLSQAKAGGDALRKNADAFALDRQWWVGLKRKLSGFDKAHAKAFVGPKPSDKEAPVVRDGTLAEAGMKADAAEKIDAVCKEWADNDDQAFAVCIVRHGVIVLHRAYGQRDGKPMAVTTKSWMASITKTMSASLMMMLVDQGLVDLDDPIDKYLPALRDIKVEKPITIRHLYTHTNGLEKWPGWNDEQADVEERVADYYPRVKVGKDWGYNGTGYILGGKIIEAVTGEAVPVFFQHHLLDPLGCPNTDVLGTHADAQSVPLDIAKFGQMLLNKGAYGKHRFFREETFEKMLPVRLTALLGPDAKRTFGIGLDGKPEKFGHGAASAATFSVDREEDLVVIMTRNKMGKNQGKYNGKFWDAIKNGIEKK
ncbi:MAG: beta-lactamase family protein [Gemmataceae bacterium]|nr:beta-lactamase family protein [Gemmataceae bacterium]